MSNKTKRITRVASTCLAMSLLAPSMTNAQSNPMSDWSSNCIPYQQAKQQSNAQQIGSVADSDPYLIGAANKNVAAPNPAQQANGGGNANFSCNGAVKSVFDNALNSASGLLGFDIGTLLGGVANSQSGNICGGVNQAIGSTFGGLNLNCPHVNIPGFNNSCHVGLSANNNGIGFNSGGSLGGYSGGTNTNAGYGGNYQGSGYYNAGQGNSGNVNVNGNASNGTQTVSGSQNGNSFLQKAQNSVSCWLGQGC